MRFVIPWISALRLHQETDSRVLKSQLDVIARVSPHNWVATPLWALALAALGSDLTGWFGWQPFTQTAIFPLIVTAVSFSVYRLYGVYRAQAPEELARLSLWNHRFALAQLAISAAWGMLPWLAWQEGLVRNHLFILLAVATTLSSLMVGRATSRLMVLTGMAPLVLLCTARFIIDQSWTDLVLAALAPLYAMHLFLEGGPVTRRLEEDVRLRLKVEDLAAALRQTRDEALKKRYEAETANAAKSAFLANMSHELRTPLNAILGFSDIIANLAMGPREVERYSDYARDIHASGSHLLSLINDLLDVAKIEAGKMEIEPKPINVQHVIDGVGRLMTSRFAEKRQQFTIALAPDLPLLVADERALKQMLLNLVSNASKFTPQDGHVSVTCGMTVRGGMEFCVDDNGPGIAPDKLARIFQPFAQIDNRYDREIGGTGLGLALVQGLVQLHGGRAWLESDPGKGTRAYLYFPSTLEAAPRREIA